MRKYRASFNARKVFDDGEVVELNLTLTCFGMTRDDAHHDAIVTVHELLGLDSSHWVFSARINVDLALTGLAD